jgi:hypothetical protein
LTLLTSARAGSQALALEASHDNVVGLQHQGSGPQGMSEDQDHSQSEVMMFYEITVASVDQPKLLSRLSEALVGSRTHVYGRHDASLLRLSAACLGWCAYVPAWLLLSLLTRK